MGAGRRGAPVPCFEIMPDLVALKLGLVVRGRSSGSAGGRLLSMNSAGTKLRPVSMADADTDVRPVQLSLFEAIRLAVLRWISC